jgi:hypothetical protein
MIHDRKDDTMPVTKRHAAIYVSNFSSRGPETQRSLQSLIEQCRQYCAEREYELVEQHIYQGGNEPFWSDAPHLVRLRTAALQKQFDVLVVPEPETLGISWPEPWLSLSAALAIHGFYEQGVYIESVVDREGYHDVDKQILKAALNFVTLHVQAKAHPPKKQQE